MSSAAQQTRGGRITRLLTSPYLLLAFAVLCWAGNFIAGRAGRDVLPPIAFNFWRWAIAILLLLPFVAPALWRERREVVRHARILALLGGIGIAAFQSLVYLGLSQTEALNAFVYFAISPLFFGLFAWLVFGDRISARQMAGVVVSMAGAIAVITRGEPAALLSLRFATGDLWLLLAVMLWALYSVLLRLRPKELSPLVFLASIILFALAMLAPVYLAELALGARIDLGRESAIALAYTAVFASLLAFIAWNRGVAEAGPIPAGAALQLMPVFGAGLAILFLGETLEAYHLVAALAVVVGLRLARRRR